MNATIEKKIVMAIASLIFVGNWFPPGFQDLWSSFKEYTITNDRDALQLPGVNGVQRPENPPQFGSAPHEAGGVSDAGTVGEGVGHGGW